MDVNDPDEHVTIDLDSRERRIGRRSSAPSESEQRRRAERRDVGDAAMPGERAMPGDPTMGDADMREGFSGTPMAPETAPASPLDASPRAGHDAPMAEHDDRMTMPFPDPVAGHSPTLMAEFSPGAASEHDAMASEARHGRSPGRHRPTSTDVGRGLRRHEIGVVVQRCIDLRTDEPVGEEVFVRWRHPDLGELRPARFLDTCTPTMTAKVDRRVIHEALQVVHRRIERRERVPEMWLNLALASLRPFRTRWQLGRMARALDADLTSLVLEIPHADLLAARPRDLKHLQRLTRHGAVVHVDQAMVERLDELDLEAITVRAIKVDATQINARVGVTPIDAGTDLPHWARDHDVAVIVQKLETMEQRDQAQAMGLWLAQGHLIAEPEPVPA